MANDKTAERSEPLTPGERAALAAATEGAPPAPGDLAHESQYERRRDAGCGAEEEDPRERALRRSGRTDQRG